MDSPALDSFLLQLEASTWENKRLLDRSRIKNGPQALTRLIAKIDKSIALYSSKKPKKSMTRKKRDLYHLKNKILIDDFRTEKFGLEMMMSDGLSSTRNFHTNRCHLCVVESGVVQPEESALNTNLDKYSMRLTGYPKTLLDNLHDRPANAAGKEAAAYIWSIQKQLAAIIAGDKAGDHHSLIPHTESCPTSLLEMLHILQLIEGVFCRDFNSVERGDERSAQGDEDSVRSYFVCCVDILCKLAEWDKQEHATTCEGNESDAESNGDSDENGDAHKKELLLLPLVLTQAMKSLCALLMMDTAFLTHQQTSEHNAKLAEVLAWWATEIVEERRRPFLKKESILSGHVSYYSTLVADTLTVAKCLLHILASEANISGNAVMHRLVKAVDALAVVSILEVCSHHSSERRVCKGDIMVVEALCKEADACLSYAAACLCTGHLTAETLLLLAEGKQLCVSVRKNLALQSKWLQTLLTAVLFINMSTAPGTVETDDEYTARKKQEMINKIQGISNGDGGGDRQRLCAFLAACIPDILKAMEAFLSVSSLQHTSLMLLRLLFRLPYLSRNEMETLLEGDDGLPDNDEEMRAERLLKLKEEHNLEGVDDDDISVEDFFVWKEKHLDEDDAFLSDWRDGRGVSIGRLLYEEGQACLQSREVVEQWLLLIRHLCVTSPLAVMCLTESMVEEAVEKVLSIQNNDVYIVALGRICLKELGVG